jgi:septum formation protein
MMDSVPSPALVLASASASRASILRSAGLDVATEPATIDEATIKESLRHEGAESDHVAEVLAELKAKRVSERFFDAFVIGADQVLDCEGAWYDKPGNPDDARQQLKALRGKTHELISAVCIVRGGVRLWHHTARARMTMRDFSDGFVEEYLSAVGAEVCRSVGSYQLEGRGVQLFSRIEGDYFTILGLPLLPLLDFLRAHGVVPK